MRTLADGKERGRSWDRLRPDLALRVFAGAAAVAAGASTANLVALALKALVEVPVVARVGGWSNVVVVVVVVVVADTGPRAVDALAFLDLVPRDRGGGADLLVAADGLECRAVRSGLVGAAR